MHLLQLHFSTTVRTLAGDEISAEWCPVFKKAYHDFVAGHNPRSITPSPDVTTFYPPTSAFEQSPSSEASASALVSETLAWSITSEDITLIGVPYGT